MNAELKKERAIDLIVSIFHYGKFKAETPNEKELETILRELRLWPTSESEIKKRSEWYESQPLTEGEGEKCGPRNSGCVPENGLCVIHKPQQESNKEERKSEEFVEWQCSTCGRDWSVTTIKCPMCFKEEPSKKEEQRCGGLGCKLPWQHPGACYPGVSQEPSKKPVCYCGHPKERHFVQYKSLVEGNQLSCRHCECFEYADNELHNQGEI